VNALSYSGLCRVPSSAGRWPGRSVPRLALLTVVALVATIGVSVVPAEAATTNLALGAVATATSSENAGLGPDKAIDGDPATRWSSAFSDPQALTIDLGARAHITGVTLRWEAAFATAYRIETSPDGSAWTAVHEQTAGDGGVDEITGLDAAARYVRMAGTARATPYGYSLFEFEVYGEFLEQAVSIGAGTTNLPEGGTVTVPVLLNRPADHVITVKYATADGTASAGADYVASSGTLTFPAGETRKDITLSGVDDGFHEPSETFTLTLSEPVPADTLVSPRATVTVTVLDNDPLPFDGKTRTVDDFETGVPAEIFTFGSDADDHPTLSTVPAADRPGGTADNDALRLQYAISGYGGFTHNLSTAQDWLQYDGFSFWVKGTASGQSIQFEVKDGGTDAEHSELFESRFVDDLAGWKKVQVPFKNFTRRTDFQPPGAPTDGTLDLGAMWGYAVNLPVASGLLLIDQVEVYQQVLTIDRFEGEVPFAAPPQAGIFTFGGDADDNPTLSLRAADSRPGAAPGNRALHGDYDISAYGGVVHDISFNTEPQDWSAFKGFRFWWFGQNTAPLPPGSGRRIFLEVKDGGANAEASELWNTSFTDDFEGWTLIQIPFSQFVFRPDYQPVGGIDHILNLTQMWGYAFTMPVGAPGAFDLDDVQVYGVSTGSPKVRVGVDRPVYPVNEGDTATVRITVSTVDGAPLDKPVTLRFGTGTGTATAGSDYTPASGTATLPAGTLSGTAQVLTVLTLADGTPETAETIPVTIDADGANVPEDLPTIVINAHGLPYLDRGLPVPARVADLLSRMTLDEKVGQMTQAERNALIRQDDIATANLGSLLSGGGSVPTPNTPAAWADMIDGYQLRARQTRLQIPLIYGADAVHGHNNVVGATLFPHNIGLGATRDPALVAQTGQVTATEVRSTGVAWDFAPCLCVSRDERWGRAYESFGEDPALVSLMTSIVDGLQGTDLASNTSVLATAKHFVGDGGTLYGSSTTGNYKIDQGVFVGSREELWAVHIAPFVEAVRRGTGSVMPSYSSVDFIGDSAGPVKMHANAELITTVLKGQLHFDGFVVSDWQAIDQIPGDYASDVRTSINAGLDMIMVPTQYEVFVSTLKAEVLAGRVQMSRIDDAVSRILRQKFRLGLFDKPYADRTHLTEVGSAEHRTVARQAATESQVLVKNTGNLLPLRRDAKIYVAGSNADDLGNQLGGWSVTWQGASGTTTTGTTILAGMRQVAPQAQLSYSRDASAPTAGFDVGVVVVGETPYAEGVGDVGVGGHDLRLSTMDRTAIDRVCGALKCVVLVVSGRPLLLADQLDKITALVASWLPGTEGAGVAEPLFGVKPYTGRLPLTWARSMDQLPINVGDASYAPLYPYGWGLRTDNPRDRLTALRDQLAAIHGDPFAATAAISLSLALLPPNWAADGSVRNAAPVLFWLNVAAAALTSSTKDSYAQDDVLVSVARDLAQQAMVTAGIRTPADVASLTARADAALAGGRPDTAARLLTQAYFGTIRT
jgi:beta-glucosidase